MQYVDNNGVFLVKNLRLEDINYNENAVNVDLKISRETSQSGKNNVTIELLYDGGIESVKLKDVPTQNMTDKQFVEYTAEAIKYNNDHSFTNLSRSLKQRELYINTFKMFADGIPNAKDYEKDPEKLVEKVGFGSGLPEEKKFSYAIAAASNSAEGAELAHKSIIMTYLSVRQDLANGVCYAFDRYVDEETDKLRKQLMKSKKALELIEKKPFWEKAKSPVEYYKTVSALKKEILEINNRANDFKKNNPNISFGNSIPNEWVLRETSPDLKPVGVEKLSPRMEKFFESVKSTVDNLKQVNKMVTKCVNDKGYFMNSDNKLVKIKPIEIENGLRTRQSERQGQDR